jgi:hypothetical protein
MEHLLFPVSITSIFTIKYIDFFILIAAHVAGVIVDGQGENVFPLTWSAIDGK